MPEHITPHAAPCSTLLAGQSPSSTTHELKCWPEFFDAIASGLKRHDLRRSDRTFRVGNLLRLMEFDPLAQRLTGRAQFVEVTYVTSAEQPCALSNDALHSDYCILSIARVHHA